MKISLREISIADLCAGYVDDEENGVRGYGGKLDIRPPYQREFVYKDKQRDAVIHTVMNGFPLNVMYWAVRNDGTFEVIDGQQRTISICQYAAGLFSVNQLYIHNLQDAQHDRFMGYKLMVYFCEGTDEERLNWFRTINIAGERLTDQELRNAVYAGPWVTDAKRYFSKNNCAAYQIGSKYINGTCIRQEYLETAIKWMNNGKVEDYMSAHQHDPNALALWTYFQSVITWVEGTFEHTADRQRLMKGVEWGPLYNQFKDQVLDTKAIETTLARLILDDEVTNKKGIFTYVLTGKESALSLRAFSEKQRQEVYARQKGKCPICKKHFELNEMEADHITPWSQGGTTNNNNCQMLCKECNRRKSDK